MAQTWDSTHKAAVITLSSGNLIATATASGNDAPVYASLGVSSGKFYWEVMLASDAQVGAGIGNVSTNAANGEWLGLAADSVGWYSNGVVITGGNNTATWQSFGSGVTLCFAMDLTSATKKLWGRLGATGNWNNDVIGNQNPAANTGGLAIPSFVTVAAVVAGASLKNNTLPDVATGVFAHGSWAGIPPPEFIGFDETAFGWSPPAVSF